MIKKLHQLHDAHQQLPQLLHQQLHDASSIPFTPPDLQHATWERRGTWEGGGGGGGEGRREEGRRLKGEEGRIKVRRKSRIFKNENDLNTSTFRNELSKLMITNKLL